MSVRREVVTLSQLLRRNENPSSRRGAGRAPPLPLQRSRRQPNSAPFTGIPATPTQQPLSFTQQLRDANRVSSSQPEIGASSQTSSAALSQEVVYDPECEQLSAMTSMSQSSFSQTLSQNLLGSSQDDHLQRLQQWQAQHALPPVPPPAHPNHSEKLLELEKNLTQAFIEHAYQQKQQQQEVMERFARPIKNSVEEVKEKLGTTSDDLKQQKNSLADLADSVKGVAKSVTDLRQQNLENSAACEETRKAVVTEAAAVKAALTELQARIDTVEGSVVTCSDRVSRVLEGERSEHEALLSAIAASSCNCPEEGLPDVKSAESASGSGQTTGKRRRSPQRCEEAERKPARSPSIDGSSPRVRARSSPRYEVDISVWQEDEADSRGLHHALERIESLRSKRRSYQYTR
ncbi:hypothetical protein PF005_g1295 [Phytophthora fragariae]|uniref:Uncharacterized protein n=1 Tax=Phytophthora fragariae TaxID=53985 RepID=A0A6A3MPW9_9STRA|nr:hypothetical protein PF009_g1317 [Phytophthora fragariae]KAE9030053.1 hypothetical protein PF011_g789 [Phytophthora fragariae]KAE9138174.1 hypothetical protein PF010_g1025 [Phytophthora fragariae]KAE9138975.1 hypothetical protein PF007_g1185 [Phytophthora fragariae]KAE9154969.1 hypothetical protein PF006_g1026 [Phytophthora fragariae]